MIAPHSVQLMTDSPLVLFKAIAAQHLGVSIWLAREDLAWLDDPGPVPARVKHGYADQAASEPIDIQAQLNARRIVLSCKDGSAFRIVTLIAPEPPANKNVLALTDEGEVVVLQQTDAARHPNGVTQIYGAEPGLVVITREVIRRATRGPFLEGHAVASYVREVLTPDGWKAAIEALVIPSNIIKSWSLA